MKRFLYRSSVEEAVHALHAKIRSGAVNLGGDTHVMPYSGVQTFLDHGVARPHLMPAGIATSTVSKQYESHQQSPWLWRNGFNVSSYDYGKTVRTGTCACCGEVTELEGTSVWWGIGGLSYLNGNTEEARRRPDLSPDQALTSRVLAALSCSLTNSLSTSCLSEGWNGWDAHP